MTSSSHWSGVADVLNLVKHHSEKYKSTRPAATKRERLSGWAALIGGVIFLAGEVVRQVYGPKLPSSYLAYLSLSILGLFTFLAGVIVNLVESIRTTRRPFVEHLDGIIAVIPRDSELITVLERFETIVLQLARERLKLESTKVASRLGIIGGGDGLRTSLVGVAMLGAALVSQYESVVHGWTMKIVAFFGVALLLGASIGGLIVRYGASQADYYSEIIGLAIQSKAQTERKLREPFSRRVGSRKRSNAIRS